MANIDPNTGQPIFTPNVPTVAPVPVAPPAPTMQTVYSAPNLSQAANAPVQAPVLNEYDAFLNTPEQQAARAEVARLQQAINAEKQGLRSTTTGLEYQNDQAMGTTGASINLIGRQVGRASDLSTNRQAALGEQYQGALQLQQALESTAREKYNIVQAEKAKINALVAQTGGQAGITPTDTFDTAVQKAYTWEQNQKKEAEKKAKKEAEDAKKEAEKATLKAQLRALGLKTSGSRKELEKRLNKAIKNDKSKKDKIDEIELALKKKELAKPYYAPEKTTKADIALQYESALPLLVDKNTGFADANKVLQLDQEYFAETGKNFSKETLDRILAPEDPMRSRFGFKD